ncbi:hypothetical protein TWF281_007497 [Arthrobotrys megalospora]
MTTMLSTYYTPRKRKTWLQRQFLLFEVTFCPYVMTPGEKWAFYTFLFFFLSLLMAAVALYLPQHLQTVARRVCFYIYGDDSVIRDVDVLGYKSAFVEGSKSIVTTLLSGNNFMDTAPGFSAGHGDVKSYMG